jgi:hypothetical protein
MNKTNRAPTSKPEKKEEVAKLPVELATKNETLKCLVVVKNSLTYFGSKDRKTGLMNWRLTANPKRLFDRLDVIGADASLDQATKDKKVSEAFKSFTSPVPKVSFEAKTEVEQEFKKSESPVAVVAESKTP